MRLPGFVKNITTLITGGVIANVITFAATPIVSRLFHPKDFGVAALFASIVTILSVLVTLRYEHAVVLPDTDREATDLAVLTTMITGVTTTVLFVVMAGVYVYLPGMPWVQVLGGWFLVVPLAVLLGALANIVVGVSTRDKKFGRIAASEVSQVGTMAGIRIVVGVIQGSGVGVLITGLLIGNVFRLSVLLSSYLGRAKQFAAAFDKGGAVILLRRYIQFPRYSLPTGLLRSFGQNIPVFALAYMFSPAVVGLYAMAFRLLYIPLAVIGEAVRRTYLQKASEIHNRGEGLLASLVKTTSGLLVLGLLIFSPLFIWGAEFLSWLLGEKWRGAGEYVAILAPWFLIMFVQSSSSAIYVVYQRQDSLFKIHLVATVFLASAFFVANQFQLSAKNTLIAASGVGALSNFIIIALGLVLARKADSTGDCS